MRMRMLRTALAGVLLLGVVSLTRADSVCLIDPAKKAEDKDRESEQRNITIEDEGPGGIKIKMKMGKNDVIKQVPVKDIVFVVYETPSVSRLTFRAVQQGELGPVGIESQASKAAGRGDGRLFPAGGGNEGPPDGPALLAVQDGRGDDAASRGRPDEDGHGDQDVDGLQEGRREHLDDHARAEDAGPAARGRRKN